MEQSNFDLSNNLFDLCLGFHNILLNIHVVQLSLSHSSGNPGVPFLSVIKVKMNTRFLLPGLIPWLQVVLPSAFLHSYSFFLFESVHWLSPPEIHCFKWRGFCAFFPFIFFILAKEHGKYVQNLSDFGPIKHLEFCMVVITAHLEDYLVFIPVWSMEVIQLGSCAPCCLDFVQNQGHTNPPQDSLQTYFIFCITFMADVSLLQTLEAKGFFSLLRS